MILNLRKNNFNKKKPMKFLHPPAVTPRTHSPSNTDIDHFLSRPSVNSCSESESGLRLQISKRLKCVWKSLKEIQNSPSLSKFRPNSSFCESEMYCHSGALKMVVCKQITFETYKIITCHSMHHSIPIRYPMDFLI